jgi:PKD repeat protein
VFAAGGGGTILRGYRNGTMGISPSVATVSGANNRVHLTALPGAGGVQLTGVPITWSSSDPAIATVDDDGWVTGVTTGTAVISAAAFGGAGATANITVDLTMRPPVATIDNPSRDTTITRGEAVQFRGTATDADGTIATHAWDYGDGTTASVEDPPAHTYAAIGNYRVTYRVTDNDGMSSPAAAVTVTVVANQIPTVTITSPLNWATYAPGATITFTGRATDHEDGVLTGASLVWTSDRDGQIGTGTSFTRSDLSLGTHRITLLATDSNGAGGSAEVTIHVTAVAPIATGEWHGSTTGMALDFNVGADARYVTQVKYTFSGLQCGGATLVSGSVTRSTTPGWEITDRQFSIASTPSVPGITGTFGDNGTTVTGTWTWLTCSGSWSGSH